MLREERREGLRAARQRRRENDPWRYAAPRAGRKVLRLDSIFKYILRYNKRVSKRKKNKESCNLTYHLSPSVSLFLSHESRASIFASYRFHVTFDSHEIKTFTV